MITIAIYFYNKKTEFLVDTKKIEIPYDLVLAAAEEDDDGGLSVAIAKKKEIDYFNCRSFEMTNDIKNYAIKNYPETKEKFDQYLYDFIGRHGLGPEYD